MPYMYVDLDLDGFSDADIEEEARRRGIIVGIDSMASCLKGLACPDEIKQRLLDWLAQPVADEEKLARWVQWATQGVAAPVAEAAAPRLFEQEEGMNHGSSTD